MHLRSKFKSLNYIQLIEIIIMDTSYALKKETRADPQKAKQQKSCSKQRTRDQIFSKN